MRCLGNPARPVTPRAIPRGNVRFLQAGAAHILLPKGGGGLVQENHSLRLTERKNLSVTGVTEVVRFDEDAVVLQTDMGTLTVQGEQLQLKELSVEGGRVTVEGTISALSYETPRQSGSFLQRLLG